MTSEQQKEYQARREEAIKMLASMELNPVAQMSLDNMGDDKFAIKVVVDLADLKYLGVPATVKEGTLPPSQEIEEAEVKEIKG